MIRYKIQRKKVKKNEGRDPFKAVRLGCSLLWRTISASFSILSTVSTACVNCSPDLPEPVMNGSMVSSLYWKRTVGHQYADIWLSSISSLRESFIVGNTGYIVSKPANLLPEELVHRSQRPALYIFNNHDRHYGFI